MREREEERKPHEVIALSFGVAAFYFLFPQTIYFLVKGVS